MGTGGINSGSHMQYCLITMAIVETGQAFCKAYKSGIFLSVYRKCFCRRIRSILMLSSQSTLLVDESIKITVERLKNPPQLTVRNEQDQFHISFFLPSSFPPSFVFPSLQFCWPRIRLWLSIPPAEESDVRQGHNMSYPGISHCHQSFSILELHSTSLTSLSF